VFRYLSSEKSSVSLDTSLLSLKTRLASAQEQAEARARKYQEQADARAIEFQEKLTKTQKEAQEEFKNDLHKLLDKFSYKIVVGAIISGS